MATLSVEDVPYNGKVPTFNAAANGGDDFPNDGRTLIYVKNTTPTLALTIATTATVHGGGLAVADNVINFAATEERLIGPFPVNLYGNSVGLTYDDETGVTIAVLRFALNPQ